MCFSNSVRWICKSLIAALYPAASESGVNEITSLCTPTTPFYIELGNPGPLTMSYQPILHTESILFTMNVRLSFMAVITLHLINSLFTFMNYC